MKSCEGCKYLVTWKKDIGNSFITGHQCKLYCIWLKYFPEVPEVCDYDSRID